jgi:hypothetical protein
MSRPMKRQAWQRVRRAIALSAATGIVASLAIWGYVGYSRKSKLAQALADAFSAPHVKAITSLPRCDAAVWHQHLRRCGRASRTFWDFVNYDLSGASFSKLSFQDDHFVGSTLPESDFRGAIFRDTTFDRCSAPKTDFGGSRFQSSAFDECDLSGASFSGAMLEDGTVLQNCDLRGASFAGAVLGPGAVAIVDCDLRDADFSNVRAKQPLRLLLRPSAILGFRGTGAELPLSSMPRLHRLYAQFSGVTALPEAPGKEVPPSLMALPRPPP